MGRTIKFRFWNGEEMIDGDSLAFEEYAPLTHLLSVDGIMQYTGLQDRNGKEIYEGDILSNGQHINWIVSHHEASFVVKHVGQITSDSWVLNRGMAESREVIGNIYEEAK